MKTLEITGKTVEEALENALKELNVTVDEISYEILSEGSKGFFNFIGTKRAKILVTVNRDYKDKAYKFLKDILQSMGVEAEIEIKEDNNVLRINLTGQKMGIIIGYRGETLDSIQYLVSLVVNKEHQGVYKRVIIDTENYRKKREETLKQLAIKTAFKVKKLKKMFKLEPMNPYERRIIHSALENDKYVATYSQGDEPYRCVIVDIKNNK